MTPPQAMRDVPNTTPEPLPTGRTLLIDAGIDRVRVLVLDPAAPAAAILEIPGGEEIGRSLAARGIDGRVAAGTVFVTGRLAEVVQDALGTGTVVPAVAAYWAAARERVARRPATLAVIDLSASGYLVVTVNADGSLHEASPHVNSRCGAGVGVNLARVLQKLAIGFDGVDVVLAPYLGADGAQARHALPVRADRCGVFSTSATISDKNQGIPLAHALATTLKSEVAKPCRLVPPDTQSVILAGGVFRWQFARDCASDLLLARGVGSVEFDAGADLLFCGLQALAAAARRAPHGAANVIPGYREQLLERPSFAAVRATLEAGRLFLRLPEGPAPDRPLTGRDALRIALDVGSTMAKAAVADAGGGELLFLGTYGNSGDTIDTIKLFFRELRARAGDALPITSVAVTGSARYQVRQALTGVYPALADRIVTLVENYAHARGSLELARAHLSHLRACGVEDLNEDFCVLVDVGGEDTKVSTISLGHGELFDNAMNIKCSAGTGSLMDTLAGLFGIPSIVEAYRRAATAPVSWEINATCAVILMESARRLQARGCDPDGILASACWAVVENMARTLWSQIRVPPRTVVLLHGQPMASDPIPLAVASRLQVFTRQPMYCVVPPHPGHRACFGLLSPDTTGAPAAAPVTVRLSDFIEREYNRRIVVCKGAVCGDPDARCHRTALSDRSAGGNVHFSLGGCSAINERLSQGHDAKPATRVPDSYRALWAAADAPLPRSESPDRLVIPRAFAVSEWAFFLSHVFGGLGIPVHVDNVRAADILAGQPQFQVDACAPHLGLVGQMLRLAASPHGVILAPQIEFLPIGGRSLGRTCTVNQGGFATARALAEAAVPDARIHLFHLNLRHLDPGVIASELASRCRPVFSHYRVSVAAAEFESRVAQALTAHRELHGRLADTAADFVEQALADGHSVGLLLGREYILNPGIYDSHVGRLLRDRGIVALPGWVLDVEPDPEFEYLYWRNPHLVASVVQAVARRRLHERLRHPRLAELVRRIETGGDLLSLVFVSTFQCGPDSVTAPLLAEMTRDRPFLSIQSDAVIQELAHLESRVNTYTRQLERGLHRELFGESRGGFEVAVLDDLNLAGEINRERDVICLPTLSDNRFLTSVLRSAGFTCIDNYADETYDLELAVRRGRGAAGEAVCTPLAAVYGDITAAMEELNARKLAGDPQLAGKKRVLMINNKGLGPCRQGQYVEVHKLLHSRSHGAAADTDEDLPMQFLVALENRGFDLGLGRGLLLRGIQGAVLQGVLHQMLFDAGVRCANAAAYETLERDYRALKQRVFTLQESYREPAGRIARARAFTAHRGALKRLLREFAARWIECAPPMEPRPIRIHVEGETYMRVAQAEPLFRHLLAILGVRRFQFGYTPVWSFLDYKLAGIVMRSRETAQDRHFRLRRSGDPATRALLRRDRNRKLLRHLRTRGLQALLRQYLAAPLYRAGGVALPDSMSHALEKAGALIPSRRPGGELVPYVGEVLSQLQSGRDIVFNIAPEGCMVSTMAEAMTPRLRQEAGRGQIQHLFSAQGDIDRDLVALAVLRAVGPERFFGQS